MSFKCMCGLKASVLNLLNGSCPHCGESIRGSQIQTTGFLKRIDAFLIKIAYKYFNGKPIGTGGRHNTGANYK